VKTNRVVAAAAVAAVALTMVACSDNKTGNQGTDTPATGKTELTVWSWDGTVGETVAGFEAANPDIKVTVTNAGSSSDEYKALDNAIQAGTGIPDIVMFEYFAVPYFAIPGKLADLGELGASGFGDDYVAAAWSDVQVDGKIYALPSDYGPAVMFYNKATFDQAGVTEAPATWDDYYQAAKKIHALGDDYYIQNDTSDLFLLLSLIWQAGGRPFQVDGYSVKIDFNDQGTAKAVAFWQKMLDEGLLNLEIQNWSDEWNRVLNEGTLASQTIGGWLTSTLPERAPGAAGDWRVAPMPQWQAGQVAGGENGGSSHSITADSPNKEAAFKFLEYFTHGDGLQTRVELGAFVPNTSVLQDPGFQDADNPYFGDQKYNQVLAQAAADVSPGWQYPPFFEYARSIYPDISTPQYSAGKVDLANILEQWGQKVTDYGNEQGFEVS
jgi:multiple sugar transport system substrate-binding protein